MRGIGVGGVVVWVFLVIMIGGEIRGRKGYGGEVEEGGGGGEEVVGRGEKMMVGMREEFKGGVGWMMGYGEVVWGVRVEEGEGL